jgi:cytochrome c-type biogenesis protein CcmF
VLAAWIPLTAGITLGSAWAYYELGWGGWWFWDPVENASLMPWLLGTALLHSALVLERRGALVSWTILLAILTFSLSLVGTFLVRSGILTSVHAFAVDPERGVYILGIIAVTTGVSLGLYGWRAPAIRSGALFQPLSREGGVTLNNLFLTALTATVFLGTFSPVFIEMLNGDKISVGPPYYARTFGPLAVPLMMLVVFGPMLNWKRDDVRKTLDRLRAPLIVAGVVLLAALPFGGLKGIGAAGGLALAAWLIVGSFAVLGRRWWAGRAYLSRSVRTTPRSIWGLSLAHAGLGLLTLGITGVTSWESDKVLNMRPGETVEFAGRVLTLRGLEMVQGPNYEARRATFVVKGRGPEYELRSERRFYPSAQSQTTEAGIRVGPLGNLYVSVGEESADGVIVRLWNHPLIVWIWVGGFVMSIGGLVSLSDRRLRIGAAVKQRQALAQPVAAE